MKNCEKESIASKSLTKTVAIATGNIKHTQRQLHNRKINKQTALQEVSFNIAFIACPADATKA